MIRQYDDKEALLGSWKTKLTNIKTKRTVAYQQLMAILDDTESNIDARIEAFNTLRKQLLSTQHGQGFFWNSHFEWLGRMITFFSLPWKNPQPGSRLRQALLAQPTITTSKLLTLSDYETCELLTTELSINDYEDALFKHPIKALADIKHTLSIEKVHALKYRVDANLYQYLLAKLYQHDTKNTLHYFYQCYMSDTLDPPASQDFVELHMMAQALIGYFVTTNCNIYCHNHLGLTLLSLLSLKDPYKLLTDIDNQDPDALTIQLKQQLAELTFVHYQHQTKKSIIHPKKDSSGMVIPPLHLLSELYQAIESLKHRDNFHDIIKRVKHPLMNHVSRLLIERMFIDYLNNPKEDMWKVGHYGFDSVNLIDKHILNAKFQGFSEEYQQNFLNRLTYSSFVPKDMRRAEQYAARLIIAQAQNLQSFIITIRRLRSERKNNFNPFEIEWITSRLSEINPRLLPFLNHMLGHINIYDQPDNNKFSVNNDPDILLNTLEHYLEQAKQAFHLFNSDDENKAIHAAVHLFHQCLSLQSLTCQQLNRLFNHYLPQLSLNYITPELCRQWRQKLRTMQSNSLSWTADDIAKMSEAMTNDNLESAGKHLKNARIAHGQDYHSDFVNEQKESKLAVYYLAQYFKQALLNQHDEAISLLSALHHYLAPEQFATWNAQLEQAAITKKSATNQTVRFFYQAENMADSLTNSPASSLR